MSSKSKIGDAKESFELVSLTAQEALNDERKKFLSEEEGRIPTTKAELRARYYWGLGLLFLVIILWVGSSVLTQKLFDDFNFPAPFVITYLSTALFAVYLSPIVWNFCRPRLEESLAKHVSGLSHLAPRIGGQYPHPCPGWYPVMQVAIRLFPVWFITTYTFNLSLRLTSVASNTILSNTSGLFVLALSRCLLHVPVPWVHIAGVVCTIMGCVVVGLRDESSGKGISPTFGDFLSIVSSFFYALFSILLKMKVDDKFDMKLLFGFIGLLNTLTMWPFLIIVHILDIESVVAPSASAFFVLVMTALIGTVLADYLWARSVLLTSPLIATLGLSLMVPFAMVSDLVFNDSSFSMWYLIGSMFVVGGFFMVNWTYRSKLNQQYTGGEEQGDEEEQEQLTASSASAPSSLYERPKEIPPAGPPPKSTKLGSKAPKKTSQVAPTESQENGGVSASVGGMCGIGGTNNKRGVGSPGNDNNNNGAGPPSVAIMIEGETQPNTTTTAAAATTTTAAVASSSSHTTTTATTTNNTSVEEQLLQPEKNPYEVDPGLEPELDAILDRYQGGAQEPDSADADAELQDLLNKY